MSKLNRVDMVMKLNAVHPNLNCMRTEDFDGTQGGIWISGENDVADKKGKQLFSYYNDGSTYKFGVINHLVALLKKHGWYAEWYDAGTVMLWEI